MDASSGRLSLSALTLDRLSDNRSSYFNDNLGIGERTNNRANHLANAFVANRRAK
ncbi:MAG TPA: hypothetical protein VGI94_18935 [Reyranella sp.]